MDELDVVLEAKALHMAKQNPNYLLWRKGLLNLYKHLRMELDDTQREWLKDMFIARWKMSEYEMKYAYELGLQHGQEKS